MVKVIRAFCWHQTFVPKRFSAFAPGLYTCIKPLKTCIKSDFEEIILKLATYGQREKAFLLSYNFVPNGLSALAWGYIHVKKTHKKMVKSRLQGAFLSKTDKIRFAYYRIWRQIDIIGYLNGSTSSKFVSASFRSFTFGAECISMWLLCSYCINLNTKLLIN